MLYTIKQNQLKRADLRLLQKVMIAHGGEATVSQARQLLITGSGGMVVQILFAFVMFGALGLIFWPLALLAVPVAIGMPFRAVKENRKWNQALPADRGNDYLVLP